MTKTTGLFLTTLVLTATMAYGQNTLIGRVGGAYTMDFKKIGLLTALEVGHDFDEMINLNVGGGFQKTGEKQITRDDTVSQSGVKTYKKMVVEDAHYVYPIRGGLRIRLPIGGSILPVLSGGLGYVLYNWKANAKDETTNEALAPLSEGLYRGFYWDIGTGIDWKLGSRSSLLVDLSYQSSEPQNKNDYARNLGGILLSLGLLLEY